MMYPQNIILKISGNYRYDIPYVSDRFDENLEYFIEKNPIFFEKEEIEVLNVVYKRSLKLSYFGDKEKHYKDKEKSLLKKMRSKEFSKYIFVGKDSIIEYNNLQSIKKMREGEFPTDLSTPIELSGISKRSFLVLKRNGIKTINDLVKNINNFNRLKGFGEITRYEVISYLKKAGLTNE